MRNFITHNELYAERRIANFEQLYIQVEAHLENPEQYNLPPGFMHFEALPKISEMTELQLREEIRRRVRTDLLKLPPFEERPPVPNINTGSQIPSDEFLLRERLHDLRDESNGVPLINSRLVHDQTNFWRTNRTTVRPEERRRRMETAPNANFEDEIAQAFGEISLHEESSSPPQPLPPVQFLTSPVKHAPRPVVKPQPYRHHKGKLNGG